MLFFKANVKQDSPCLAWLYLVQEAEMPFCVGDGAEDSLPDEPDGGESVVLVGTVELVKGAVELLGGVVPLPYCCAFALVDAFDTRGGM